MKKTAIISFLFLLSTTLLLLNPLSWSQAALDEARFSSKLVGPNVWRIDDKGGDNIYLVEGKDKALLIDTGLGIGDLKKYASTLTKLPITVVNTHGHRDHAGGNFQFDEVFAHRGDFDLIQRSDNHEKRIAGLKPVVLHEIKEGHRFDLGGRQLEVIEVPGHTPGSIVLLDAANKLLLTGDNDNTLVWLFLKDSLPLETYLATLKKVNSRNDFVTMLPGHGDPLDKAFIADQIAATEAILNGTCTPKPYKSGVAGDALVCEYNRAAVAYDPQKLRKK